MTHPPTLTVRCAFDLQQTVTQRWQHRLAVGLLFGNMDLVFSFDSPCFGSFAGYPGGAVRVKPLSIRYSTLAFPSHTCFVAICMSKFVSALIILAVTCTAPAPPGFLRKIIRSRLTASKDTHPLTPSTSEEGRTRNAGLERRRTLSSFSRTQRLRRERSRRCDLCREAKGKGGGGLEGGWAVRTAYTFHRYVSPALTLARVEYIQSAELVIHLCRVIGGGGWVRTSCLLLTFPLVLGRIRRRQNLCRRAVTSYPHITAMCVSKHRGAIPGQVQHWV